MCVIVSGIVSGVIDVSGINVGCDCSLVLIFVVVMEFFVFSVDVGVVVDLVVDWF